jgi:dihydropteroate synthase
MFSLNCKGKLLLIEKPLVMGILNITDDSFYPESRVQNMEAIKNKATQMMNEGADIIDIGAQSTRPGSRRILAEEELEKLMPAIEMLTNLFPGIIISIDTYHALVAKESVSAGATMVNDISAGEMDKNMLSTVASLEVPYICMHMKGVPETMQQQAYYNDVTKEVLDFFIKKTEECRLAGINDVIIDLPVFKMLDKPILAGLSRKSTIYKTLQIPVEDSLNGTTVLHTIALQHGASILRVHDVKEAKEAITLWEAYTKA